VKLFRSETAFHRWILAEARDRGWRGAHLEAVQLVRKPQGTIAVPSRDAAGFPDLVLVHREHGLLFAECKMHRANGRPQPLRPEQVVWITELRVWNRVYVWTPADQDEILAALAGDFVSPARLFDQEGLAEGVSP
jgi:hypothetical protein